MSTTTIAGPHILNVEDYAPSRYVRSRVLREAGFRVTEAETVAAAVRALHDGPVSLVVLDMNLPDGMGTDLCRHIRDNQKFAKTPILMISATARGELDRLDGVRNGANVYLTEPVSPTLLVSTVDQLLANDTR